MLQIPVEEVCTRSECGCPAQWETVRLGRSDSFTAVVGSVTHCRQLVSLKHFRDPHRMAAEAALLGKHGWARVLGCAGDATLVLPHYPLGSIASLLSETPQLFDEQTRLAICVQVARAMEEVNVEEASVLWDSGRLDWSRVHLCSPFHWNVELLHLGSSEEDAVASARFRDDFEAFESMVAEMGLACEAEDKQWSSVKVMAPVVQVKKTVAATLLVAPAPQQWPVDPQTAVYNAAIAGEGESVMRMLRGADSGGELVRKAVRGASKGGRVQLLLSLLREYPGQVNNALNACGSAGYAAIVHNLLQLEGADVNRAAIGAAFGGYDKLVWELLELDAELEWCVDGAARAGHTALVERLLALDDTGECVNVALAGAAEAQFVTLTKRLLQLPGADVNSALFGAAAGNREDLVAYLLQEYAGTAKVQSAIEGAEKGRHSRLLDSLTAGGTPNATPQKASQKRT